MARHCLQPIHLLMLPFLPLLTHQIIRFPSTPSPHKASSDDRTHGVVKPAPVTLYYIWFIISMLFYTKFGIFLPFSTPEYLACFGPLPTPCGRTSFSLRTAASAPRQCTFCSRFWGCIVEMRTCQMRINRFYCSSPRNCTKLFLVQASQATTVQ